MTSDDAKPATMSAKELAELFGIHPNSIYLLAAQDKLPVHAIHLGRKVVFSRSEVEALLFQKGTDEENR